MNRRPADDVADFFSAVQWLRTAWTTLPVAPAKLHTRDIDGQLGQRYSAAFAKVLTGLGGWRSITVQDVCYHPTLPRDRDGITGSPFDCGDCQGTGLHLVERELYDHPMYVALERLSRIPAPAVDRPSSFDVVMAMAYSGWDLDASCRRLRAPIVSDDHRETMRALVLMSIRRLYNEYATRRVPRRERSDSQVNAEGWDLQSDVKAPLTGRH